VDFSFFAALLKMLFALAVVLGLLMASVYFLKRYLSPAGGPDDGQAVRILAARSLGPKSSILVVDILGKVVALGVTASQISVIADLDDPAALDRLRRRGGGPAPSPFPQSLEKYANLIRSLGSSRKGGPS